MKTHYSKLLKYELWANQKVFKAILSLETISDKMQAIVSHILAAQAVWYERLVSSELKTEPWQSYSSDLWLESLESNLKNYQTLIVQAESFNTVITYHNSKGKVFETSIEDILSHLITHSSYHRGQLIILLKPLLESLPWVDYIAFLREDD